MSTSQKTVFHIQSEEQKARTMGKWMSMQRCLWKQLLKTVCRHDPSAARIDGLQP